MSHPHTSMYTFVSLDNPTVFGVSENVVIIGNVNYNRKFFNLFLLNKTLSKKCMKNL